MSWLVGFRGTPALVLKFAILFVIDLVGGIAAVAAFGGGAPAVGGTLVAVLLFLNYVYVVSHSVPARFMAPGIVFLTVFVIVPIVYTVSMSGYNFRAGHVLGKEEATTQVLARGVVAAEPSVDFDMTLGKDASGNYAALLKNQLDGVVSLATADGLKPLAEGEYGVDENGVPNSTDGFTALTVDEIGALGDGISAITFPAGDGNYVAPQFDTLASLMVKDLEYDAKTDVITRISTGDQYKDDGNGSFSNVNDPADTLSPGWRNANFPQNFTGLFADPTIRGPFLRVFSWTIMFAFLSVLTTFIVGLALALAMDAPFRGRATYRSILILPYAIPSFMSILVWRGMFNRDFGIINRLLMDWGLISENIGWFDSTWTARGVVVLVNLWLGFPYMYLISSGALQAIPSDLKEAAAIDGCNPWQAFRKVTLPLLLKILFPLLISSFAFNFNNFNIIYLLTAGAPKDALAGESAGGTDILISYAYQIAVGDPNVRNFGLASAISMFMFLIVGVLSIWSLRRAKALEEF